MLLLVRVASDALRRRSHHIAQSNAAFGEQRQHLQLQLEQMLVIGAVHLVAHKVGQPHQILNVVAARPTALDNLACDARDRTVAQPLAIRLGGDVE